MESEDQRPDYVGVVDNVLQLIGEVLNREIIHAVVVHCNGDLNEAVDAIMNMDETKFPAVVKTNTSPTPGTPAIPPKPIIHSVAMSQHMPQNLDAPSSVEIANNPISNSSLEELSSIPANHCADTIITISEENASAVVQTSTSCTPGNQTIQSTQLNNADTISQVTQNLYAPITVEIANTPIATTVVPKSKGAVPKRPKKPNEINNETCNIWTLQTKQIVDYHHQGCRTLILMRGLHISGKTYLATKLLHAMCPDADCKTHILSTYDFFNDKYNYDQSRLSEAHIWNQNRAREAMHRGLSPIFIDNNNVEILEMEPYVKDGLNNGYIIEVVEPNTPWAKRANQVAQNKSLSDSYNQNGITVNEAVDAIMNMDETKFPAVVKTNTSPTPGTPAIPPKPIIHSVAMSQHMPQNLDAPSSVEIANNPISNSSLEELSSIPANHCADTIITISEENASAVVQTSTSCTPGNQTIQSTQLNNADTISQVTQNLYAPITVEIANTPIATTVVPKSKGAVPKRPKKPNEINNETCNIWTLQTKQIVDYHHQGCRTLILMRGLHISGKTYLATKLLHAMCPDADCKTHILSTYDFFNDKYNYDQSRLSEAHIWNQNRAREAMHRGLSPIFIDNNNVEILEMEPYVKDGLNNGYIIEVVEPNTPWAKRANQVAQNKSLSDSYNQNGITGIYVIRSCGLSYSADKKPPMKRNNPPILAASTISQLEQLISTDSDQSVLIPDSSTIQDNPLILSTSNTLRMIQPKITSPDQTSVLLPHSRTIKKKIETGLVDQKEFELNSSFTTSTSSIKATNPSDDQAHSGNGDESSITPDDIDIITFTELRKQLKVIEKLDRECNESWNENSQSCSISQVEEKAVLATPLHNKGLVDTENRLLSNSNGNDGSKNSMQEKQEQWNEFHHNVPSNIKVETATHSTSIELDDTNMNSKNFKILIGTPKDINYYYMGLNHEDIPNIRMLDKSSMTSEHDYNSSEIESESYGMEIDVFDSQACDDYERTVNVNLGILFVAELDQMFGRSDMIYPDNIMTKVNMPMSLLNEINALWVESLMDQLDQQSRQTQLMLNQDEEFARQLSLKEEQFAQAGLEPAVPDLEEVMDMELALSIYKDEITAEWRNNEPNDFAARTTRERLYNLFPDVQSETLSEVLMAHDSNFTATVEILLLSTSNAHILDEENGVAKFIAKKELERQKTILEEQKKAVSEVLWPILPKEVKVDMSTFQDYRAKASHHLAKRNLYYQKAQEFFKRDMTDIASYYSDVAVMHKNKYERANSLAAATLMQIHAEKSDNSTIDLHYLHVPEAMVSLDLFIDTHIQKLQESKTTGGPRYHTVFIVTGRGKHSIGGPRIKPAVKKRLGQRGIAFAERNPGLLTSKLCAEDQLTHQLR